MSRLDDARLVREQYATECGLEARRAVYSDSEGDDPRELAFEAVAEARPGDVLEVGCGPGELAARIRSELGARLVAVDLSERMVELTRLRGVNALVGDVQSLPFEDESFDVAVAAWVLFHVPDLDRGLAELSRVLRRGGRLVAVTNYPDHLRELREAIGAPPLFMRSSFNGDNGADTLASHFERVERREALGTATLRDRDSVVSYAESLLAIADFEPRLDNVVTPIVARRHNAVFVVTKAA